MGYCSATNVQAEFKGAPAFSSSTVPTDSDLARFIAEADAEINSALSSKYVTPITGAEALLVVRSISIAIVAARVRSILEVKTASKDKEQDAGKGSEKWARKFLQQLAEGSVKLTDATAMAPQGGVRSYNVDNDLYSSFERDTDQW